MNGICEDGSLRIHYPLLPAGTRDHLNRIGETEDVGDVELTIGRIEVGFIQEQRTTFADGRTLDQFGGIVESCGTRQESSGI